MKRIAALFTFALFAAAVPAYAIPFTWTISGTADAGSHADAIDLAGLGYVLHLTTDSLAPDQNGFNDFGTYGFNNLVASIDIDTLGTRALGNFTFVEQFNGAAEDDLRIRGNNGGAEFVLRIPHGTLGDPDFLSVWGPVLTLGTGTGVVIDDPGQPNAPFHLVDADHGDITVQTVETPEPATLALVGLGLGLAAIRRKARPAA